MRSNYLLFVDHRQVGTFWVGIPTQVCNIFRTSPASLRNVRREKEKVEQIGEDGVNWPVGLSGRPHLCDI